MSHFYERVTSKDISYEKEIDKLKTLFFEEEDLRSKHFYSTVTAHDIVDGVYFRSLMVSSNYIHFKDMWEDLISGNESEFFINVCELFLSLQQQLCKYDTSLQYDERDLFNKLGEMSDIIKIDLDRLNLKYSFIKSEIGIVATIFPKDALVEEVVGGSSSNDLTQLIIRYKSLRMEGNVKGKEELLSYMSKFVEPLLKDKALFDENKRLFDNASFLLNNLNIRHNNIEINNTDFYNKTMKNREKWLDDLFLLILLVFKAKEESRINSEVTAIKKSKCES